MTELEERPRFYEGQYLAAADLTAAVDYTRTQRARTVLGLHRWGIAFGLDITEVSGPNSSTDAVVQPGYAMDGFGRPILVAEPAKLSPALFASYDALVSPGGPPPPPVVVEVWIRYDESLGQGPRPGFETCDAQSAFSRVTERYVLEVGPRPDIASRRDQIEIAGRSMDASQALRIFDAGAPELVDASVPHQTLPAEGDNALWLVPLGVVAYQPGSPGAVTRRDAAAVLRSSRSREYTGVVAGSVEALGGVVRVHDRAQPYSAFRTDELLCVEGDIRADGNLRMFGSHVELIASHAEDPRLPIQVMRRDDLGAGTSALTLVIGDQQAGKNRLAVARQTGLSTYDVKVVVTDQGNVGVGTEQPIAPLHLPENGLQIGTSTVPEKNFHIQSSETGPRALRFLNRDLGSGVPLMSLTNTGRLGIGDTNPSNVLHVKGNLGIRQNSMYLSGDDRWSSLTFNAHHDDANGNWVFPDPAKPAVTVEMDVASGYPRFEVYSTTPGGNTTWQSRLFVHGHTGNVGVGTQYPSARLDVAGDIRFNGYDAVASASKVKVVWGAVSSTGSVAVGSGFTVSRTNPGRYVVTFAAQFAAVPVVVASRVFGDVTVDATTGVDPGQTAVVDLSQPDRAIVATADKAGTRVDGGFTFVAIGPR